MALSNVFYHNNAIASPELTKLIGELKNLHWSIPPSGIPGNHPPRYVCALGDGSRIVGSPNRVLYIKNKSYPESFAYPAYQCAKSSSALYRPKKIPINLAKLILKLRKIVQSSYGNRAKNIHRMFNVCVCNL